MDCNQLGKFNKAHSRFKELLEKSQRALKKARDLCDDAMSCKLAEDAHNLNEAITELESLIYECEGHVDNQKEKHGFSHGNMPSKDKMATLPLPTFSGGKEDELNFYTFREKFDTYIDSLPSLANCEILSILKEKCLKGIAAKMVSSEETTTAVMDKLASFYGSKDLILARKKMQNLTLELEYL